MSPRSKWRKLIKYKSKAINFKYILIMDTHQFFDWKYDTLTKVIDIKYLNKTSNFWQSIQVSLKIKAQKKKIIYNIYIYFLYIFCIYIYIYIYIISFFFFGALIFSATWIDCQKLDVLFKYFILITFVRVSYFQSKNFNDYP